MKRLSETESCIRPAFFVVIVFSLRVDEMLCIISHLLLKTLFDVST